jgi:hypothetical protein
MPSTDPTYTFPEHPRHPPIVVPSVDKGRSAGRDMALEELKIVLSGKRAAICAPVPCEFLRRVGFNDWHEIDTVDLRAERFALQELERVLLRRCGRYELDEASVPFRIASEVQDLMPISYMRLHVQSTTTYNCSHFSRRRSDFNFCSHLCHGWSVTSGCASSEVL